MSKHKDKDKNRSRSRSKERREKKKSKKNKDKDRERDRRSRSRERRHRNRSRSRSSSSDRRRQRREERDREEREKELERQRLREIALEFKQSGAFSSIANQSQSAQQLLAEPAFPNVSAYSAFNTFSLSNPIQVVEPPKPIQTKEMSQAYLEAVAASQRIAASKNFTEIFNCNNSNDSSSNGPAVSEKDSNSRDGDAASARLRRKKSRWGGTENDKTFIPGMPTILPSSLDATQQEAYLVQLQIEEISRKLRTGDLGIAPVEERSPSPEPIYSSDGKRLNTREFRTRKKLEEQRHELICKMHRINPEFKPPADYKAPVVRVSDKVLIPQEENPDINFVGLLIGPRGNTLKAMEKDTGAKIIIRGKGSVKEGKVGRKDGQPLPGEDEPLHAFITAANADCVKKAVERINEVIRQGIEVPEGHNDLRRMQLRELAQLNGTLRETDGPRCTNCGSSEHKSWLCPDKPNVTNNIMCSSCGAAGHIAKDCKAKRPGHGGPPVTDVDPSKIDEEYLSLMAELGEGPLPTKSKDESAASANNPPSNRNAFSIFDRNSAPKAIAAPPLPQQQAPKPNLNHNPNHNPNHNSNHNPNHNPNHNQIPNAVMPAANNSWNGAPIVPQPPQGNFAMPPPNIRPPPNCMWNQMQPQIPGTELPPIPGNGPPAMPPNSFAPGAQWTAPLPSQYPPWNNSPNFAPPLPAMDALLPPGLDSLPPPPPPPG